MRFLLGCIFSEYKQKILEDSYFPITPVEALKAGITATWLLLDSNPSIVKQAETFIRKTSQFKEEYLLNLKKFVSSIKTWDELQICSTYRNANGTVLEFKLSFTRRDSNKQTRHSHVNFKMIEERCLFISETTPLIRVIGDSILQKPGMLFPQEPSLEQQRELANQIEQAKSVLLQTSGAGIAANQCAKIENPYCFTVVGVFHDISEHIKGVERRYPGTTFPQAKIIVNPIITSVSKELQSFNHACLSVPCANRCAVMSPMKISITYQDYTDEMRVKHDKFTGIDAVVLWHELTHIIYGKTYMDITFESLYIEDLLQFQKMLVDDIQRRQEKYYAHVPNLTLPSFHFSVKINKNGIPRLDPKELAKVLPEMSEETLYGLLIQANRIIKKFTLVDNKWAQLGIR